MIYTPPSGDAANFSLAEYTPPLGGVADFQLADPVVEKFMLGFGVRKRLGRPEWPDPLGVFGIWQMRMTKKGKKPLRVRFYDYVITHTTPQDANRAKFAAAMTAWGALTSEQKAGYNLNAKKRQTFGWCLFIREYYKNN